MTKKEHRDTFKFVSNHLRSIYVDGVTMELRRMVSGLLRLGPDCDMLNEEKIYITILMTK